MLTKLTEAQCRAAIAAGEFGPDVVAKAGKVAVILTQSWCPQWTMMRSYLQGSSTEAGLEIFFVEYDLESFHEDFMGFKEEVFQNREIPYVRYYRDGSLTRTSNYLDKASFFRIVNS